MTPGDGWPIEAPAIRAPGTVPAREDAMRERRGVLIPKLFMV